MIAFGIVVLALLCACGTTQGASSSLPKGSKEASSRQEYAYTVALLLEGKPFCAGALIYENIVVTSARCIKFVTDPSGKVEVFAGLDLKNDKNSQRKVAKNVSVHEKYVSSDSQYDYDIAVIELDGKFTINESVKTIDIAKLTDVTTGRRSTISGWGYRTVLGQTNTGSDVLVSTEIPTVRREICQTKNSFVRDGMICAGHINGLEDDCGGDAGSPLVLENELVGVYIYSKKCEKPEAPQVFTDVPYYKDWIKQKAEEINGNSAPSHGVVISVLLTSVLLAIFV